MAKKIWGGRFSKKQDASFEAFSSSLPMDYRLLPYDLKINKVYVQALERCRVLTAAESKKLIGGLDKLEGFFKNHPLGAKSDYEDVHSAIEIILKRIIGPLADKLHTGRSRNDLVSQSTRLYCKARGAAISDWITQSQKALLSKAKEYESVFLPGMTHLQNAQVLSQAHIFLAYIEMLERVQKELTSVQASFDICVLGSGALAGSTFALDQKFIAKELGLSGVTANSYDVAGDRDFVFNFLHVLLFLGVQLSRIAEDMLLGQLRDSKLIQIDQSFCTGSSMMPQKRNADFLELARGSSGVFAANFMGCLTVLKGLPTSYNRDLQYDKKYLFDSVEHAETLLEIFVKVFKTLTVNRDVAKELLQDETLYATDLADYLTKKGVPFRQAHSEAGRLVSFSEKIKIPLSRVGLDLLQKVAPKLEGDVYELFEPTHSVKMKKTLGSTHPDEVRKQIHSWHKKFKD